MALGPRINNSTRGQDKVAHIHVGRLTAASHEIPDFSPLGIVAKFTAIKKTL
jgi:hypothetical protein